MHSLLSTPCKRMFRIAACISTLLCLLSIGVFTGRLQAQSTFGAFVGTAKDPQGAVIAGASVTLEGVGTNLKRVTTTGPDGQFGFLNIEPGSYKVTVTFPGFQTLVLTSLTLQARETQRLDSTLQVGSEAQSVSVEAAAAVINTDTSNLTETRTGIELTTLPLAVSSRAGGSTSPYSTLTSQAGVQTDSSGNISVAGAKPSLLSVTVDGISTMNVRSSIPASELFPSFNTIEEIRISQNANAAEFGGISDITTVSRGGTNQAHGGAFDNYETAGFNSKDPFATRKPKLVMNDFGLFYGGPVIIPHLYNGRDKTFYFLSYEGLRLPQQTNVIQSVPTQAMRNGDLSAYSTQIKNASGVPYAGNQIPSGDISAVSRNLLNAYYPLPNTGASTAITNNYQQNFRTPISSDQGDARIDRTITTKQNIYARYSYKQRSVTTPPSSSATAGGSALIGTFNRPEKDTSLAVAYNYAIKPTLLNELRGGLSKFITETTFSDNSTNFSKLGITGIPNLISASTAASPNVRITGFTAAGGTGSSKGSSNTYQIIDNLTWSRKAHTVKMGGDWRRMYAYSSNVFGSTRLGRYTFNGSSAVGKTIAVPMASFLLGIPDSTNLADVLAPDMNGRGNAYAMYVQDDWKITSTLTLNFGLRYEYHPMLRDKYENSAQFLPDSYTNVNGTNVRGVVVVPTAYAINNNVLASFRNGIAPMPILTAAQAGISSALVSVAKDDFAPRFGFAWRPLHNDKTVIRGGFGRFIAGALGGNVVGGWAVSASAVNSYTNAYSGGKPTLSFPNPFGTPNATSSGSLDFNYAITPNYKDPTVQQWNLTVEQDLGFSTGMRVSYAGSHGQNLGMEGDANQLPYGTGTPNTAQRPFPTMNSMYQVRNLASSNYNAVTIEGTHRMSHGLQFQSSYTFARNLSEEGGSNPTSNASEIGGIPSDIYHPGVDYGNVIYTRRHRFLGSFLYELPFGHNKSYLSNVGYLLNSLVNDWQLAGYYLQQSGAFLTPITSSVDPTGTGMISKGFATYSRPDAVVGVSPYTSGKGIRNFLTATAFANPAANIGRQGTASVGSVVGPGTNTFSTSLMKSLVFTERVKFQMGAQVQNLFNHHNYDIPSSLDLATSSIKNGIETGSFGQITSMQSKDNAGPRAISLTARLSF
ncbi:TonB-dependent receptor [Terriglobus albidus]|nr:TonB-dependent receptor [Terriglobus albidus]